MRLPGTWGAWGLLLLTGLAVAEAPADFAFGVPLEASGPQALLQV